MPWWAVWSLVGLLAVLLIGWLIAVISLRLGIRTHADLSARIYAERRAEREAAQAERAAAGRDDTARG
jgi:hypothetical protein